MMAEQLLKLGSLDVRVDETLDVFDRNHFSERLWAKDASLWKTEPKHVQRILNNLGWLTIVDTMHGRMEEVTSFADEVKQKAFSDVVLLGIGGSSLAREVYLEIFGIAEGAVNLIVLESTIPEAILDVERSIDIANTLFLLVSKSGETLETELLYRYFWDKVFNIKGEQAGENFVAITTSNTPLEKHAREMKFRHTFLFPGDVWGRSRALTYPGLIPAALIGVDVRLLIKRAQEAMNANGPEIRVRENPGIVLGVALGELYKSGCDKLTFLTSPSLKGLSYWVEQLIAESTGKEGKGIIPVDAEPLPSLSSSKLRAVYGDDRAFVYMRLEGEGANDELVSELELSHYPIIHINVEQKIDLGQELLRWSFAMMAVGRSLAINPFDEPNFHETKAHTSQLLDDLFSRGQWPGDPIWDRSSKSEWRERLSHWLSQVERHDYVAIQRIFIGHPQLKGYSK